MLTNCATNSPPTNTYCLTYEPACLTHEQLILQPAAQVAMNNNVKWAAQCPAQAAKFKCQKVLKPAPPKMSYPPKFPSGNKATEASPPLDVTPTSTPMKYKIFMAAFTGLLVAIFFWWKVLSPKNAKADDSPRTGT